MLIEQAYRDYRDAMIRGMTSFSGDEQAALDAVSHAFTKALGNKLFLENMPEPAMKAWLYAAARNGLVDIKRREKRLAGFPEDELTEERQIDLADRVTVAALLVKLPQALRKPIQLKDREHLLDRYEKVNLNCGALIVSSEINAKLAEKNASLNTGTVHIHDIKGEVVQLNRHTLIDGKTSYKDLFVLATEDLIISGKGAESFREAEGVIVTGVLYYPESSCLACLAKVQGDMRSYPDDAQVVLGNRTLEQALADAMPGKKHIWVSGELTALDEKTAARAREEHFTITSRSLLTYEGLNEIYGDIFVSPQRSLVPDGYEVTGSIKSAELVLHGPKLYVQGNLDFEEKDLGVLEEMESIIVKGRANLPSSCAKAFRKIGQADDYYVFEGRLHTVNGFEQFSHDQLRTMAERGDRLTITVNGCLLFADDVTADDMEAIAALSYNGMVLIPGAAKGALSAKIKGANGHMGDAETFQKLTGLSLDEMLNKQGGGPAEGINAGTYTLI